MSQQSLEDLLQTVDSPVELLRNSQIGPYAFPVVKHEFTNWREEQRSWRESCALFDQSHHMTDLYIKGPDTIRLLSELGINTFKNFKHNKAKQFVACNYDGYVIGDAILFYLAPDEAVLVGRPPALNWTQFHAETGDYDVSVERDERSFDNKGQRKSYRYQVQ
jgi:glycine cleavage system aminomethyltransferase T